MKTVTIIALHLAYGGIEKAVTELANLLAEWYNVHIFSVYDMPNAPAYPLDERVTVTYLLKDIPNRAELQDALSKKDPAGIAREGVRAAKILYEKRLSVIRLIRSIGNGIVITTRDEHNVLLSRYGRSGVLKIAQLHQDHGNDPALLRHFQKDYGGIDVFTLLSPKMEREVKSIMGKNRHTKVLYIPNFMETLPEKPEMAKKEKTVLAAGRLHPVKGFDRLIDLFCEVHDARPDWNLTILGGGEEEQALLKKIRENRAEGFITLAGRRSPEEVSQEMAHASVYALTSYSEGFPFVLLEAMSCCLPIAAFDTRGGLDMLVKDGENGFLVTEKQGFANALLRLTGEDDLREKMAVRSRSLSEQFTRDTVKETWFRLIEEYNADGKGK